MKILLIVELCCGLLLADGSDDVAPLAPKTDCAYTAAQQSGALQKTAADLKAGLAGKSVLVAGPPGSGKGTQGELLANLLGFTFVSSSAVLRKAAVEDRLVAEQMLDFLEYKGAPPHHIAIPIMLARLSQADTRGGVVIEGFPRDQEGHEAYERQELSLPRATAILINLELSPRDAKLRLAGRSTCPHCSRSYHREHVPSQIPGLCDHCDTSPLVIRDNPDTIESRFRSYERRMLPVIAELNERNLVINFDARTPPLQLHAEIVQALSNRFAR